MKIACFLHDLNTGGPHRRVQAVHQCLVQRGHKARVFLPSGVGTALSFFQNANCEVEQLSVPRLAPPRRPIDFVSYYSQLARWIRTVRTRIFEYHPDVVHVNGAIDLVPAFAAKAARRPLVWHLNDTLFRPSVARTLGQLVTRTADQVVVAARAVANHYGLRNGDYEVLHAPVDTNRFYPRRERTGVSSPMRLGLIANWNRVKGQDKFLDVVAELLSRGASVEAVTMGTVLETQRDYWQPLFERIDREFASVVRRLGFVEDTPSALDELDVLLLTSRSEACPISVLEAMACGVPVVSFDVGGVREMLLDRGPPAGIVVAPGDVAAMSEAVLELRTSDQKYAGLSCAGPRRAREAFSLDMCVRRHLSVYQLATKHAPGTHAPQ